MEQKTTVAGKLALRAGMILLGLLFAALLVLCQSPRSFFGEDGHRETPAPAEQTDLPEGAEFEEDCPSGTVQAFGAGSPVCPVFLPADGPGSEGGKEGIVGASACPNATRAEACSGELLNGRSGEVFPAVSVPAGSSAVVLERDSLRVLYEREAYVRRPMASTTKIVTALVALQVCPDLDRKREIPASAVGVEGSSIYLRKGEHLSMRELLYGLMLRSGNDAAVAVAELCAGSVEEFVLMMNRAAADLGCTDTHFCNPHGLHHPDHYTTAYDLAVLTAAAMKDPVFREIVGTRKITISNEGFDYDRLLVNKNKMLASLPGATGVKTGYTKAAGRCLVSSCEREGMECISVVLNCGPMWEVSAALLEEALQNFRMTDLRAPYEGVGELTKGEERLPLYCREKFAFPLREGEKEELSFRLETGEGPFDPGESVGKIKIYLGNDLIFSAKLYTMEEIEQRDFLSALFRILRRWRPGR